MTDIVERLRHGAHPEYAATVIVSDTLREAADEIERLREENKFLRHLVADELRRLEKDNDHAL